MLSRAKFLRLAGLLGGTAAYAAFLQACQKAGLVTTFTAPAAQKPAGTHLPVTEQAEITLESPEDTPTAVETPQPVQTADKNLARVALIKTTDRASGVRRAVGLLGDLPVRGRSIFLKPNFNSSDPAPGSTHPDVLSSLVLLLQEMGASSITVGDRSGMGDTRGVMEDLGIFELGKKLGFETVVFDELPAESWVKFDPPGSHWKQGFYLARPCLDCGALVQACCLKTHRFGGHFTMSLKNSVGMVAKKVPGIRHDFMNELHTTTSQRYKIAEVNSAYQPALIVMDGVEGFSSGGPASGKLIRPEVILAGTDRIAMDAVGVAILRYFGTTRQVSEGPIFELEQIKRAVELGLGVDSPEMIEIVTDDQAGADFAEEITPILVCRAGC